MALLFFQIFWDFWKFYSIGQTKAIRYFSRPYRTHWRLPNWPCSDRTWPFRQAKANWYLVWPHRTRLMLPDWPYNDQIWHAKQLQTIQSELPHPVCASWPISERVTCDVDTRPRPHTSIIVFTRIKSDALHSLPIRARCQWRQMFSRARAVNQFKSLCNGPITCPDS